MRRLLVGLALATVTLLATLQHARAAPAETAAPSAATRQQAALLAKRGFALHDQGRYLEAIEHFRKAEELHHAPPHLWYMALAYTKRDRLVEAHRLCVQVAVEPLPASAPAAYHDAQLKARQALHRLSDKVTGLKIVVTGVPAAEAVVTLDGKPIGAAELDYAVALEPRSYALAGSAEGFEAAPRQVEVPVEGPPSRVELTFTPKPLSDTAPADRPPPPPPPPPPAAAADASAGGSLLPGAVTLAVGGAGLVLGAVTGAIALHQVGQIKDKCVNDVCLPDQADEADGAAVLGHVSTVGFIAGGAIAAAGVVLLIIQPGGSSDAEPSAEPAVAARIGPGSFALVGTF